MPVLPEPGAAAGPAMVEADPGPDRDRRPRWLRGLARTLAPGTLRGRLLWLMGAALLLSLGALGLNTVAAQSEALRLGMRDQAAAMARSVALAVVNPMVTQQFDVIEQALLLNAQFPGVVSLQVFDAAGATVGATRLGPNGQPALRFDRAAPVALPSAPQASTQVVVADGRELVEAWYPIASQPLLGWVRVRQSLGGLGALREQVMWRTAAAGAAAALASSLLLVVLMRGPLRALEAAQRFAVGLSRHSGRQLSLPRGGPRETVALVTALNQASLRLAQQGRTIEEAMGQLQLHSVALDERNQLLDAVLALSPNGLVSFDRDDKVRFANAAFGRLTGLDPIAVIGLSLHDFERRLRARCEQPAAWPGLAPCFVAGADEHAARALLTLAAPRSVELHLVGRHAEPEADGRASAIGRLLSLHDVTHEREVDRMKTEFLSTAAHELRTPMVSIHGFSELLARRDYPADARQAMVQTIHRHSVGMIRIVNDLLDLARIESRGGADFQCEPADLGELVTAAVQDLAPPPGREPVRLDAARTPLPVRVDAGKLRQVLGNLVGNAYKYSPGGGTVALRLFAEPAGRPGSSAARAGFELRDQGMGMSADQVARVFERFYRADPSGTILGTGLGMSIVKELIELHGGEVAVASTPGQGTTVTVWLPMVDVAPAYDVDAPSPAGASATLATAAAPAARDARTALAA